MTQSDEQTDIAMAFVAVSSNRLPDAMSIQKAVQSQSGLFGKLKSLFSNEKPEWAEGGILIIPVQDAQIAVALLPVPIPWSDLEGPCETSLYWENAGSEMKTHTAHFLITLVGGNIANVARRVILTRVVSAILQSTDAIGVYWPEGTIVHRPDFFIDSAKDCASSNIPGPLWIDIRIVPNPDQSIRCFTTGLAPLGFREIEVHSCSTRSPQDLYFFIGDLACYIVNSRVVIKDGETVGHSAQERIKVQYAPSLFNRDPVIQLIMS